MTIPERTHIRSPSTTSARGTVLDVANELDHLVVVGDEPLLEGERRAAGDVPLHGVREAEQQHDGVCLGERSAQHRGEDGRGVKHLDGQSPRHEAAQALDDETSSRKVGTS